MAKKDVETQEPQETGTGLTPEVRQPEPMGRGIGFIEGAAVLMLHALVNRTTTLPTAGQAAEKAIEYAMALEVKLAERKGRG